MEAIRMTKSDEILRILREEYGIKTPKELDKAIKKLKPIDLHPFCGEVKSNKKKEIPT